MDKNVKRAKAEFDRTRSPYNDRFIGLVPSQTGVYGVYTKLPYIGELRIVRELVYVGKTQNLRQRITNYFDTRDSSQFTCKCSIGTLLAFTTCLRNGNTQISNYRFIDEDEENLIEWMYGHLEFGFVANSQASLKNALITEFSPILNIGNNTNANKMLKTLRDQARIEARLRISCD